MITLHNKRVRQNIGTSGTNKNLHTGTIVMAVNILQVLRIEPWELANSLWSTAPKSKKTKSVLAIFVLPTKMELLHLKKALATWIEYYLLLLGLE